MHLLDIIVGMTLKFTDCKIMMPQMNLFSFNQSFVKLQKIYWEKREREGEREGGWEKVRNIELRLR